MDTLLEHLKDDEGDTKIVYIAVGCAANLEEKKIDFLKDHENQQFPVFLRDIQKKYNFPIYILLADPLLTKPPYIINNGWDLNDDCYQKDNIKVFTINKIFDYEKNKEKFKTLNKFCFDNQHLLFFHDYTGLDINNFYKHIEEQCKMYSKHIMYGINMRTDSGCYMDLNNIQNKPIIFEENNRYVIFNPNYTDDLVDIYNETKSEEIKEQIKIHVKYKYKIFTESIIPYRQLLLNINAYKNDPIEIYKEKILLHKNIKHINDYIIAPIDVYYDCVIKEISKIFNQILEDSFGIFKNNHLNIAGREYDNMLNVISTTFIESSYKVNEVALNIFKEEFYKLFNCEYDDVYIYDSFI